jgi:hypothetical protein
VYPQQYCTIYFELFVLWLSNQYPHLVARPDPTPMDWSGVKSSLGALEADMMMMIKPTTPDKEEIRVR